MYWNCLVPSDLLSVIGSVCPPVLHQVGLTSCPSSSLSILLSFIKSVCPSSSLSVLLSFINSVCLSSNLSVCLSSSLSVLDQISLSFIMCVCPPVLRQICLSSCPSSNLSVLLSFIKSVRPSVRPMSRNSFRNCSVFFLSKFGIKHSTFCNQTWYQTLNLLQANLVSNAQSFVTKHGGIQHFVTKLGMDSQPFVTKLGISHSTSCNQTWFQTLSLL